MANNAARRDLNRGPVSLAAKKIEPEIGTGCDRWLCVITLADGRQFFRVRIPAKGREPETLESLNWIHRDGFKAGPLWREVATR